METTDKDTMVPPDNGSQNQASSADRTWEEGKHPSWQKSIKKEYWGNEKLSKYESLNDVIESVVNPVPKAPEKYELGLGEGFDDVESVLRKADVSQEDAKALADAIKGRLPKKYSHEALGEDYGADFEQAEKDFSKAVGKILTDEKVKGAFLELKDNPAVFEFARIVGKNLGEAPNLGIGKEQAGVKKDEDPFISRLLAKKK